MSRESEDQKAFMELQAKMIESQRRVNLINAQIEVKQREIKRANFTEQELARMPDATKTYKAVGKMFLLLPIDDMKNDLRHKIKHDENEVTDLKKAKMSVERVLKDTEDNIRELMKQQQQQAPRRD